GQPFPHFLDLPAVFFLRLVQLLQVLLIDSQLIPCGAEAFLPCAEDPFASLAASPCRGPAGRADPYAPLQLCPAFFTYHMSHRLSSFCPAAGGRALVFRAAYSQFRLTGSTLSFFPVTYNLQ